MDKEREKEIHDLPADVSQYGKRDVLPNDFTTQYYTRVLDQGLCGSCWVHMAISVAEGACKRVNNSTLYLSPRQLIGMYVSTTVSTHACVRALTLFVSLSLSLCIKRSCEGFIEWV